MTLEQYENLKQFEGFETNEEFSKFVIEELKKLDMENELIYNQDYLTLLHGYTVVRETFDVNIEEGKIVVVNGKETIFPTSFQECIPNKRVYPKTTNFFFTKLCNQFGFNVCFTSWH